MAHVSSSRVLVGSIIAALTVVGATQAPAMQPGIVRHASPGISSSHGEGEQSVLSDMSMPSLIGTAPRLPRASHSVRSPIVTGDANDPLIPPGESWTMNAHANKEKSRKRDVMGTKATRFPCWRCRDTYGNSSRGNPYACDPT